MKQKLTITRVESMCLSDQKIPDDKGSTGQLVDGSESGTAAEEKRTSWRAVWIAALVSFLCAVEGNIMALGEWPYMQILDKEATVQFVGNSSSISRAIHALAALLFALWQHKYQHTKWPLLAGRGVCYIGIVLYLLIEYFPSNRRYVMITCYIIFNVGSSAMTILRSYLVCVSSEEQRPKAFALFMLANLLSVVVSPLAQLAFSGMHYPGVQVIPGIRLHIYSAPVWIALVTNSLAVVVLLCLFKDTPKMPKTQKGEFSLAHLKQMFRDVMALPLNWALVAVCIFEKIVNQFNITVLNTVTSPLMMTVFGFTGSQTVTAMAILLVAVGLLALTSSLLFILCKLATRVNMRILYAVSFACIIIMYVATYPYPSDTNAMPRYNNETGTGCNPLEYKWCETGRAGSAIVYLAAIAIVMGLSFPLATVSLDTIYSKVLGQIDQSMMQGVMIAAEDIALVLSPMFSTWIFADYGLPPLWITSASIISSGIVVWIVAFKWLKPYS